MPTPLLEIRNLKLAVADNIDSKNGVIVEKLNLTVNNVEVVALVGGSGGGKTMTGLSILRLLPPGINIEEGTIMLEGENLLKLSESRIRQVRGKKVSMIFQEPLSAFNPVFTVGFQVEEVLRFHEKLQRKQRREKVWHLLDSVGISDPKRIAKSYPHQLSGGLRQRAMIAQAIAGEPKLIIADEPTSNLDVTLQARIIELFRKLRVNFKMSILLITHDLGVVNQLADKIAVLYNKKIVEEGSAQEIMKNPKHPFTEELIKSIEV